MKKLNNIFFLLLFLPLLAFTGASSEKNIEVVGTYGVNKMENPIIQLDLNDDHSFHYIDRSNSDKEIDVRGTWKKDKNTIILSNYTSDYKFHKKWKLDEGCIKSRKGITFYRLCNLSSSCD